MQHFVNENLITANILKITNIVELLAMLESVPKVESVIVFNYSIIYAHASLSVCDV